jgi:hypothetical protein
MHAHLLERLLMTARLPRESLRNRRSTRRLGGGEAELRGGAYRLRVAQTVLWGEEGAVVSTCMPSRGAVGFASLRPEAP